MPLLRPLLLAALVATAPAVQVRVEAVDVDAVAIQRGLELRLGETARGWIVDVLPTDGGDHIHVRLQSPGGDQLHRSLTLEGEGVEERSRELASALAFIIEGQTVEGQTVAPAVVEPRPIASEAPEVVRGWVALGPRVGLGPPSGPDPDYGLAARGGVWLVREHVQPIVAFSWSRSADRDLVLDGLRFGAGAAFGTPLAGRRVWVGAGVIPHAAWTRADDLVAVAKWRSSTELAALLQVRGSWWVLGARTGLDLTLPPVRASGQDTALRWGPARFMIGLEFGLVLPPRVWRAPQPESARTPD